MKSASGHTRAFVGVEGRMMSTRHDNLTLEGRGAFELLARDTLCILPVLSLNLCKGK